jgi:Glycosyltransferase family 10 (fucosyltransferase) C-term
VNFWKDFNQESFLLTKILDQKFGNNLEVVTNQKSFVDLEISSVFQFNTTCSRIYSFLKSNLSATQKIEYVAKKEFGFTRKTNVKAKKTIWYTGENLRHPSGIYSGTLSFDRTDLDDNNFYLPYWMVALDWNKNPSSGELELSNSDLNKPRNPIRREKKACSFSSTLEPTRNKLNRAVARSMTVDNFGRAHGKWIENKHEVAQEYGFQICSENDLYPGYVTEKLIDSWISQTIPIWMGCDSEKYFNPDAILDLTQLNEDEIYEKLESLTEAQIMEIRAEPILKRMPSIKPLVSFLEKIIYE